MRPFLPAAVLALGMALAQTPTYSQDTLLVDPAPVAVADEGTSPDQTVLAAPEAEMDQAVTVPVVHLAAGHDLTVSSASLFQRIRFGFAMPDCKSPLVTEHLAAYLNRPEYFARIVDRSRRYLHHVVEEVEKRGMPTEIALLPVIESAYNPVALSPAQASGMWQFIPSTGRSHGLDENRWYDERRDVLQATEAALDYLEMLYEMFGSWDLALAAYNAGEGAVGRAISKNAAAGLPTDYLSLQLPAETRNYVPKLQAVKNLIASPARYGIVIDDIPNEAYFVAVPTQRQMDAEAAAHLAGISLSEFLSLNPAYKRPVVIPDGDRPLLVPVDKADLFETNLETNRGPLVTWRTYTVKRKERLDRVAAQLGMTPGRLAEVNGLAPGSRLKPGQTLLVQRGQAVDRIQEANESIATQLSAGDQSSISARDGGTAKRAKVAASSTSANAIRTPQARRGAPASKAAARDKSKSKKTVLAGTGH